MCQHQVRGRGSREEGESEGESVRRRSPEEPPAAAADGMQRSPEPSLGRQVRVLYDYQAKNNDELCIARGDMITLTQVLDGGWFEGESRPDARSSLVLHRNRLPRLPREGGPSPCSRCCLFLLWERRSGKLLRPWITGQVGMRRRSERGAGLLATRDKGSIRCPRPRLLSPRVSYNRAAPVASLVSERFMLRGFETRAERGKRGT